MQVLKRMLTLYIAQLCENKKPFSESYVCDDIYHKILLHKDGKSAVSVFVSLRNVFMQVSPVTHCH